MATKDIRQFYKADEKYLFIGNGPNQLKTRFSWDDLLANLCREAGLLIQRNQKAFPLFFEEISYSLDRNLPVEEIHQVDAEQHRQRVTRVLLLYSHGKTPM